MMATEKDPSEDKRDDEASRRDFLATLTWAIGALLGAGLGIPAVAYIIGPALQREETQEWIELGSTTKVELGTPTLFKAKVQRKTGWIVDEKQLSVYLLTEDGRDFVAMSNICTHLGCRVRWIANQDVFFCPCHNGVFAKDGTVLEGPPPRPLDRFDVRVEKGTLFILGG
jgi:menaquinol-cytochrome c reductase iron-sulfur subunit